MPPTEPSVVLPDTAEQLREKLETLAGEERLDISAIKGLDLEQMQKDTIEKTLGFIPSRSGGGVTSVVAGDASVSVTSSMAKGKGVATIKALGSQISKSISYNGDGTVNVITDANGTKTFSWSSGVLTTITGTGVYKNKAFTYSSGQLINITVS